MEGGSGSESSHSFDGGTSKSALVPKGSLVAELADTGWSSSSSSSDNSATPSDGGRGWQSTTPTPGSIFARSSIGISPPPLRSYGREGLAAERRIKERNREKAAEAEKKRGSEEAAQNLADEKEELEEQLKKLRDDARESENKIQILTIKNEDLQEKLDALPERTEEMRQHLTSEKKELEERLRKALDDSEELQDKIQMLESERGYLIQKLKELPDEYNETIQRLTREKKDLEEKLESEKRDFESRLESERKDLEEKLKQSQDGSQSSDDLITVLTNEKQDLEQKLKLSQDGSQSDSITIKRLTGQKKTLQERLDKVLEDDGSDAIIRQLADEKANLEEHLARHEDGANHQIQQPTRQKEDLEEALDHERQIHEAELEDQKDQKQDLAKRLDDLRDKFLTFINETENDRKRMEALHAKHAQAVKDYEGEIKAMRDAVAKLKNEKKSMSSALAEHKAQNAGLREENQNLRQELEEAKKRIEENGDGDGGDTEAVPVRDASSSDGSEPPEKPGYDQLVQYYHKVEKAFKNHKLDLDIGGARFALSGGNKDQLSNNETLVHRSREATAGDDGTTMEPFSELAEQLRAVVLRLRVDGILVRAMNGVSSEYEGVNFPAAPAPPAEKPPRWSLAAIPRRLKTWASNRTFMFLLNLVMFFFFLVATLAEGAKYAQWAKANAASRALFAENRAYACVSAPHISFFVYLVRDMFGIPRLS